MSHLREADGETAGSGPRTGRVVCPLELLHPDAVARRRTILGRNCPVSLCPAEARSGDGPSDLLIVAPDADEQRDPAFLQQVMATLAGGLSCDAVAYVLAPARWRARLCRSLSPADFTFGPTLAHVPPRKADQYLVPAEPRLMRYTAAALSNLSRGGRRLADVALRGPGVASMISRLLPESGTVIRPAGARALLEWLAVSGRPPAAAVIRTKWRGYRGTAVMHCFAGTDQWPVAIVKAVLTPGLVDRIDREAAALQSLGPAAVTAGARIPQARVVRGAADHPLLVQTYVDGRRAAALLAEGDVEPLELIERLGRWLEAWSQATAVSGVLDERWVEVELMAPVRRVAPLLSAGEAYLAWLRELAASLLGSPLPRVAAHNDLTMQNVLLAGEAPPGIIDWEAAREDGVPLSDFLYLAVDALLAAGGTGDRGAAFTACFSGASTVSARVLQRAQAMAQAVGLPSAVIPMCFHACWAQHAANELTKRPHAPARPFVSLMERVSRCPAEFLPSAAP